MSVCGEECQKTIRGTTGSLFKKKKSLGLLPPPPPLTEVADLMDQLLLPPRKADPTSTGGGASCDSSNEPQPNQQTLIRQNLAVSLLIRQKSASHQEMAANPAAVASAKTSKLANPRHQPHPQKVNSSLFPKSMTRRSAAPPFRSR